MGDSRKAQSPEDASTASIRGHDRFALTERSRLKNIRLADLFDQKSFTVEVAINPKTAIERFYTKADLIVLRSRDFGYQLSQAEKDLLTDISQLLKRLEHEFLTYLESVNHE